MSELNFTYPVRILKNLYRDFLKSIGLKESRKLKYFIWGLVFFYSALLFTKSKPLYFLSYIFTGLIFYRGGIGLVGTIIYLLSLSVFFDVGIAGRWFILEPEHINLGSGWWFSAMTGLSLFLVFLTFFKKGEKAQPTERVRSPDIFILLFLTWNGLSFISNMNVNSFFGMIQLTEYTVIFILLRLHLTGNKIKYLALLIISMVFFQSAISIGQYILKRPVGLIVEPLIQESVQTLSIIEGAELYRVTGSFGHPNMLAAFLIAASPFIFALNISSVLFILFNIIIFLIIFLTYSRISWLFFTVQYFLIIQKKRISGILNSRNLYRTLFLTPVIVILSVLIVLPYFLVRIKTTGSSLMEFGSLGLRVKLTQEALNLIRKEPLFGVGLNRSLEYYALKPSTNLFTGADPGPFYKIHNTFLEIAAESGLPGLLFFIFFLISVFLSVKYRDYNRYIIFSSLLGLAGLVTVSYVNPFFHTPLLRMMLLLTAVILA